MLRNPVIVVAGSEYSTFSIEEEIVDRIGGTIVDASSARGQSLKDLVAKADGLLVGLTVIDEGVYLAMPRCKVIVEYGVGYDNIDVQAAAKYGIVVANVPDYGTDDVADHALAMLLAIARKICLLNASTKAGQWDFSIAAPVFRLRGKILGLLGFGRIGQAVARRGQAFGLKVIAYDPYVSSEAMAKLAVQKKELDQVIAEADYLSLHLPVTAETEGLLNEAALRRMKKTAYLVNTARGKLINEKALYKAINERWIAGVALDVMTEEPPAKDNPLLELDNVIVTPHAAWYSEEANQDLRTKAAEEIVRVLKGEPPKSWVNKDLASNWRFNQ